MAPLARTLVAFALLIQAALGPAGITLDVCHGRLQWAAPEGESCCGDDGCETAAVDEPSCGCSHGSDEDSEHDEPSQGPSIEERDDCTTCFQVALESADEACETPLSLEGAMATSVALSAVPIEIVRQSPMRHARPARAPPLAIPQPGLLPGTFPLRI